MARDPDLHDSFTQHVESAFGIQFAEDEAARCATRGHVERIVLGKVVLGGPARLLLPVARERTRTALETVLGRNVPLDADLDEAFPRATRREQWRRVTRELDAQLGSARRPWWVPTLVVSAPLVVGWYLHILSRAEHFFYRWYYLITWDIVVGASLGVAVLVFVATRFVAVRIPFGTGEDVAVALATEHTTHAKLNSGDGRWSVEQVREIVEILVRLYYDAQEVRPDTPLPA